MTIQEKTIKLAEVAGFTDIMLPIPDWFFDGRFWLVFPATGLGIALGIALVLFAIENFNPFGR